MFRVANMVMLGVFLLSIAVQYNDPDPIRWSVLYGICAVLTGMAIAGRYTVFSVFAAIGFFAGVLYWMPGAPLENPSNLLTDVTMANVGVEEWREDGGLLICAVWMTVLSIAWWRARPKASTTGAAEAS